MGSRRLLGPQQDRPVHSQAARRGSRDLSNLARGADSFTSAVDGRMCPSSSDRGDLADYCYPSPLALIVIKKLRMDSAQLTAADPVGGMNGRNLVTVSGLAGRPGGIVGKTKSK